MTIDDSSYGGLEIRKSDVLIWIKHNFKEKNSSHNSLLLRQSPLEFVLVHPLVDFQINED